MKKYIYLLLLPVYLYSNNIDTIIQKEVEKNIQKNEQRNIFKQLEKNKNQSLPKVYQMEKIKIEDKRDEHCVEIENINVIGSTIYDNEDFKDFIEPLLNNCEGITQLKNLTKKITNLYIEDGYITSMAYIKPQDLSDGEVEISVLEGKVNDIKTKLNLDLIYTDLKDNILNIRDLEVGIEQIERLRSQKVNFELKPSKKIGFTDVKVIK
ncbi:MAG: ShlB/FhaC/HecB family hemolysin secretion/activation protein, partial [Arcobacter sp.]|nr:ShlB/FhaC/HecB family hemolysin secretion/activation protein [Arcobacter sp.]